MIATIGSTGAVAAVAVWLGGLAPMLGSPIVALVLGMLVGAVAPTTPLRSGLAFLSRHALQLAIVVLGTTISLGEVIRVGGSSVPVMLGSLTAALLAAWLIGRALRVPARLRVLVGVGTGICGASAIAAVGGPLRARDHEMRYAVSTIFVFNVAAVLTFPLLGHLLGMGAHAFGLWSGTAINDVSSVVAAGFAYGHAAGNYAIVVKLTRTTMIVPIVLALSAFRSRAQDAAVRLPVTGDRLATAERPDRPHGRTDRLRPALRAVPWFLVWFVAAAGADTLGLFDAGARASLSHAGLLLTTVALAAIGLSSDFGEARRTGLRPLALGACVWILVAVVSVSLQRVA